MKIEGDGQDIPLQEGLEKEAMWLLTCFVEEEVFSEFLIILIKL